MDELGIYGGWLTVNRFCNFRCGWCYATGTKFKSDDNMPFELAKNLINLMHSVGINNIILIGGETLFWPHLFQTASYIKSLGMTCTVVTNGWLLGFEKFRERVKKSDITSLNISLKAGSRQLFAELTGRDELDRVLEGLREICRWGHIEVTTSTVINTAVLNNLDDIAKIAFESGSAPMNIAMCGPTVIDGQFKAESMPEPTSIVEAVVRQYQFIHDVSRGNFSIEMSLPACIWPSDFLRVLEARDQVSFGCHFKTRSGLLFDRWGNIIPCNHLYDYHLGQFGVDFTDLESFISLWRRPEINEFYDKMLEYPAKRCIHCRSFDKCGGGCPLNWFVREPESVIGGCR